MTLSWLVMGKILGLVFRCRALNSGSKAGISYQLTSLIKWQSFLLDTAPLLGLKPPVRGGYTRDYGLVWPVFSAAPAHAAQPRTEETKTNDQLCPKYRVLPIPPVA